MDADRRRDIMRSHPSSFFKGISERFHIGKALLRFFSKCLLHYLFHRRMDTGKLLMQGWRRSKHVLRA